MARVTAIGALILFAGLVTLGATGTQEMGDAEADADSRQYTIEWAPFAAQPITDDDPVVDHFEKELGVTIDAVYLENNKYEELLNLRIASGDVPDIIYLGGTDRMYLYHNQGVLASIDESDFREYAPGVSEMIESYDEPAWQLMKIDGAVVGLPQINVNRWRRTVVWRTDWLEDLGIGAVPSTLDEVEEAVYGFRNDDPDGNGRRDTYGLSRSGMEMVFGAFGALPLPVDQFMWHERNGELVYSAVVPEMKEALRVLASWYEDGVLDPEFITGENKGGYWALSHDFANSRIGMSMRGRDYHWFKEGQVHGQSIGANAELIRELNPEMDFELAVPFTGPQGQGGGYIPNKTYIRYGLGVQLENNPAKLEKVLGVIDYITTSDIATYVTSEHGFQGEHWEFTDDGGINQLEIPDWRERQSQLGAWVRTIINPDFEKELWSGLVGWREERYEDWDENGLGYENALKIGLPSQERYKADLDALVEEVYIEIITGQRPVNYFDTFVEEWYDRGGQALTVEANEWFSSL
jgi:putative aldouronate transport system substrate-binding protein